MQLICRVESALGLKLYSYENVDGVIIPKRKKKSQQKQTLFLQVGSTYFFPNDNNAGIIISVIG